MGEDGFDPDDKEFDPVVDGFDAVVRCRFESAGEDKFDPVVMDSFCKILETSLSLVYKTQIGGHSMKDFSNMG